MSTVVSVHEYTSSVYFLFFSITCTVTFQLIYCGTYTEIFPEINLPVYLHASLSSNHKDLPVTTTTSTRSLLYLLIFIFLFRLTAKIYPLTFLLLYMSTNVPAHQYTFQFICSFSEQLPFNSSNGVTRIYPKINVPVYLHASLLSSHLSYLAHRCTCSSTYLFIVMLSFQITTKIYLSTHLLFYI